MRYDQPVPESEVRQKITKVYFIVPIAMWLLIFIITLIIKLMEKVDNSFARWGMLIFVWILILVALIGISMTIYLFVSLRNKKPTERQFNGRDFCDRKMRVELRAQTGYSLDDFTGTGDSKKGVHWVGGSRPEDREKFFYELYRLIRGQQMRYMLGVMNMEKGKEDDVTYRVLPVNINNIDGYAMKVATEMCKIQSRSVVRESVFKDEVTGRTRVDKEKSPMDLSEDTAEYGDEIIE